MEEQTKEVVFLSTPLMCKQRFADLVGVGYGVVDGWCNRDYVPTVLIGKHKLVNMALLTKECIEQLPK